ncbi:MBL fold metallo-hydrolase [Clostridium sp. JN-1]|uniref:ComEC/Rec2 family competence protein n=1 Tax=Clostridium sp. JN-1 TaxID=2483110 RepID=UPI000F0B833B|nr:MBL fold metallo-hydrolase [Clostridium sp. JN-1]
MKKRILILFIIFIFIGSTVYAKQGEYEVHFLDTGQSDCILIKAEDKNYLIDTGAAYYTDKILAYLKSLKVTKIDGLILTHYHDDHYGGLLKIADEINVDTVFLPSHYSEFKDYFRKELTNKNVNIKYISDNYDIKYKKMELKSLAPSEVSKKNENNNSIMLQGKIDDVHYLFAGDCEKKEEKYMIEMNKLEKCDVLKVPHHALNTSTTDELLDKICTKIAIVTSNGVETPDMKVINRMSQKGIIVIRTDIYGGIIIKKQILTTARGGVSIKL